MVSTTKLIQGDCLEVLEELYATDGCCVDMVLVDLPYGTTACKWDTVIDLERMWTSLSFLCEEGAAMVFTASQPFTSKLVMSKPSWFKYEWIWQKSVGSNFAVLKYQPMKEHESVLVFSKGTHNYYPIKEQRKGSGAKRMDYGHNGSTTGEAHGKQHFDGWEVGKYDKNLRNPSSVQFFNNREKGRGLHPTQKPVALMEYLIKTYTNEGETVLDFTMGSGTTGVAAKNLNRDFIGIELDPNYFKIAQERIDSA